MRYRGMVTALVLAGVPCTAAQDAPAPPPVHARRLAADPDGSAAQKAARLAEGRKKFFEQSQGFDHDLGPPTFTLPNAFPLDANGLPVPPVAPLRRR